MDAHAQQQRRTAMSDDGDHTCPLCAEEMDITDQQLKPCKCGYDICVWCWHHIIDMAEKEETEGRCPACRTRYDKDRIVKMAASCERTVAEKNAEKKHKTQKVKPKAAAAAAAAVTTSSTTVEAKKHLASVRVIQRNLVYIIGLPAHLCNESVLERREYFGQYGKVLKVSVSRPNGPPSQQASANNNISVYITYAKEEEAIRCIQSVHNFVLEGKVLRACFGTTKYCHAWLRNMTCGNPDCLYLHDIGSQEDSFTKDEVISAYTRTRVPQMASSVSQRRAGTILPPPADDFSYSAVVSAKHTVKNGTLNINNQLRVSPPNSSSGRSTLPLAASWGHRDLNARTTATGVTSSQSQEISKSEPSFSSSSSTRIPSAWSDDTSTAPTMSEGWKVPEQDSSSKTVQPYKPGIAKETQAVSSLESSLDIDFSAIPSAWTDDDIVVSDGVSKGIEEVQVVNENGKLTNLASKSPISPKKDMAVNITSTSKSPSDFVSSLAISKSNVKTGDGDCSITNTAPESPTVNDVNCQSSHAASGRILEDIVHRDADIERLSVQIASVALDGKDEVHSMVGNHQPDAMPCTSVVVPMDQNFDKDLSHLKFDGLLPSENKDTLSCQYSSDNHLDWSSELQSSSVTPLNDIVNSLTEKLNSRLMDGSDQPSYSSFARIPNTLDTLLWNNTENDPTLTIGTRTSSQMQTGFSSISNTCSLLSGGQDGLGTAYTPGNAPGYPGMGSRQPGAMGSVRINSVGSFDKTSSVNNDESRIISDMLSSEFNPWDDSYSTANNFVRMLRESENNDVPFTMPSWRSGSGSKESRFSFARQDNQGNFLESSLRNSGSEQNFSLLPQISRGNIYQNGAAFQSPEDDFPSSNSFGVSENGTTGTSWSKISAPPGFSAPARVPPPGFSSGFPSQDGMNPPPGFSSGVSSHDGSLPTPRFPSGISSQEVSKPPPRLPSPFSSGFSSQDGLKSPSRFHSAFSSGFSSLGGSNQVYGAKYPETLLRDNVLGGISNHYQAPFGRHTSDIEFNDPAILAVGKGQMPGIGDSGLEMNNTPSFRAQLQTSNHDLRFQLGMQPNVQSHQNLRFADHMQDAFNPMSNNHLASRFLAQNHGPVSPYPQRQQQPGNSQLINGHWDGWSDLRQGSNTPMSDMSRMLYPSEANNLHMLGSNDIYNRAFGM